MLTLTLNLASSIAELTVDHLQGTGFFQMLLEVLPLDCFLSTFIWAVKGVFLTNRPVLICDFDVGGFVVTICADEWPVVATICFVLLELTSLEAITTGVRTGHCHKLALSMNRVLAEMSVETAQFTHPLTSQTLVWAANFELFDLTLEEFVRDSV